MNPALKEELIKMNDKLKLTIEENKKKSGYTVNRVNIADIPSEELFNAITTPYRGKVVFVDFWATWCGPCIKLGPVIEELAEKYDGKATVGKFNVDEDGDLSTEFGIRNIPTVLFFKDGELKERSVGLVKLADLEAKLAKIL